MEDKIKSILNSVIRDFNSKWKDQQEKDMALSFYAGKITDIFIKEYYYNGGFSKEYLFQFMKYVEKNQCIVFIDKENLAQRFIKEDNNIKFE
jgi:hypothetical protein